MKRFTRSDSFAGALEVAKIERGCALLDKDYAAPSAEQLCARQPGSRYMVRLGGRLHTLGDDFAARVQADPMNTRVP